MSNPQEQQPPVGAPNAQYQPVQGQYPPPQQGGYPPQGGYQQPYGYASQGQYPPQQWQQQQQQQPYGQQYPPVPPQGQAGGPPQPGYPPAGYAQPPPPQQYGYPPAPYGAPPQQFQQPGAPLAAPLAAPAGPPTLPSPGYSPSHTVSGSMQPEIAAVRGAMNDKSGKSLMKVLADMDPIKIGSLEEKYKAQVFSDLSKDINSLVKGDAKDYLLFLIGGPLKHDVKHINKGLQENKLELVSDVLLNRSNADVSAIKEAYQRNFRIQLDSGIQRSGLDEKYKRLFLMVLAAQRTEDSVPPNPTQVSADAREVQEATEGVRFGANELAVFRILSSRNDAQIREIAAAFQRDYHKSLEAVLKKEFTGKAEDTVLLMLERAVNRAKSDAKMLEESMKGLGTDELLLESRALRVHWDRQHLANVKAAYKALYGKDLIKRVKSETSRVREDFLVAVLD